MRFTQIGLLFFVVLSVVFFCIIFSEKRALEKEKIAHGAVTSELKALKEALGEITDSSWAQMKENDVIFCYLPHYNINCREVIWARRGKGVQSIVVNPNGKWTAQVTPWDSNGTKIIFF